MSDALSSIGQFLGSGAGKAVETGATAGTGLLQNLMANREAQKKQSFVENLIQNPAAFSKFVSGFQQPLTAGLTADVARSTDAYGAERGLGSSPTVMKDIYAQALAPYVQQQQQQGTNAALSALGIYGATPTTPPINISGILKAILQGSSPQASNPTAGIDLSTVPNPGLTGMDLGLPGAVPNPLPSPIVGDSGGFDPTTMEGG